MPAVLKLALFALWHESASGQSFELRLEHPRNTEIKKSKDPTIDLRGYEKFFDGKEEVWVSKTVDFDISDLQEAHVEASPVPESEGLKPLPSVILSFTTGGSKRFSEFTKRFTKHKLAMILDGKPLTSATIFEQISSGKVSIVGIEFVEDMNAIFVRINELILLCRDPRISQLQYRGCLCPGKLESQGAQRVQIGDSKPVVFESA